MTHSRPENSLWPISWVCFGPNSLCLVRATAQLVHEIWRKQCKLTIGCFLSASTPFVLPLTPFRLIWITINMTKRWESPPQINMQHCVIYIQCQDSLLDCQYITCCLFAAVEAEHTDRARGEWMRVPLRKASGDETRDGQSGNCAADRMRSCISACDEHSFLWISLCVYALSRCLPCSELALPVDRSGGRYCVSSALLG